MTAPATTISITASRQAAGVGCGPSGATTTGVKPSGKIVRLALGLTTPSEQVLGRQAVAAGHVRHHRARRHGLLQDPRLLTG